MKKIVILGSTGSIGRQALDVVDLFPDEFEVVGLAAGSDGCALAAQAAKYRPQVIYLAGGRLDVSSLKPCPEVLTGPDGLERMALWPGVDLVLIAVTGLFGLKPALAALGHGVDVALANKEALVAGGHLVMARARGRGACLFPVDSEHSALWQCLGERSPGEVENLILTASGGPFRRTPAQELERVTARQALAHPNWSMGRKITVDSATLMNKGLEVLEAKWLFGFDLDHIKVVVHPQSIVHALIKLVDGTHLACLSQPDMRLPIQYALFYPERRKSGLTSLDLTATGLTFEPPDTKRFPCLELAYAAGRLGGTAPAVLNAANEVAVEAFLAGRIKFTGIYRVVERVLEKHTVEYDPDLETIMDCDRRARINAQGAVDAGEDWA